MSLRRKLAGVIAGAALAALIPVGTASANDGFECSLQFEPPPECFDPPPPPEEPPPPPDGMIPVGDMMQTNPVPMPSTPMPSQPGEKCSTYGLKSDAFAWEMGAWRIRKQYTFTLSGTVCISGFQVKQPVSRAFVTVDLPRDPRLKRISQPRTIGPDGVGTGDYFQGEVIFVEFCSDPRAVESCTTYRHTLFVRITPFGWSAAADLTIVPGPFPSGTPTI